MHWTLQLMLVLCVACASLNLMQYALVRSVRLSGLLVCSAWSLQQAMWWQLGHDSFAATFSCDLLISAHLASRLQISRESDKMILALIPFTMVCYGWRYLIAESANVWWIGWYLVAAQMVLGLPRPSFQTIAGVVSHGPRKPLLFERNS